MRPVEPARASGLAGDVALALGLIVLVGWPLAAIVDEAASGGALRAGGALLDNAIQDEVIRPLRLAWETIRLVLAVEAIALPAGMALAILTFRTDLVGRRCLLGLLALSVFVPIPMHATAWLGAIGNAGRAQALGASPILVGWRGAAFIHAMASLPWVVLLTGAGLRSIEPELEEAARLERPASGVLRRVTLRRSVGAILAAALAVAVLTAGEMTVTDLLQVRTYAEEVYVQSQLGEGPAAAAKVAVPPLVLIGTLIVASARVLRRADPARLVSPRTVARPWRLGSWRGAVGLVTVGVVAAVLAVPIYGLLWRAGRVGGHGAGGPGLRWSWGGLVGTLRRAWPDVAEPSALSYRPLLSPLVGTLLWAGLGASLAVGIGWGLAWKARRPGPWAAAAVLTVAALLAAPGPIVGLALKIAYLRVPWVHDTGVIVILAYAARTLPYAVVLLWPALRIIPPEHLEVAATEGYGPWGVLRRVAVPLSRGPLVAAWGASFVLASGELAASNIVLPPGLMTIPVRVWMLLHTGVESHLAGVGLLLIGFYALLGRGAAWLLGRATRPG